MKCFTSDHLKWLVNTGKKLKTADGKDVEIWEFRHQNDEAVLSAWAKHFRNHYCLDGDLDLLIGKRKLSRKDYLNSSIFPSKTSKLGPAIRAGDFGEILVADFLQWFLKLWVPRVRWGSKEIPDESPKGSDVIGFRFQEKKKASNSDLLVVFEIKTKFSKGNNQNRLQDAINDSVKDSVRVAESLNSLKRKLAVKKELNQVNLIERFQDPVDVPYQLSYGAAALYADELFKDFEIGSADTTKIPKAKPAKDFAPHPNRDKLVLLVIKGANMMKLVHELYRRAADEA